MLTCLRVFLSLFFLTVAFLFFSTNSFAAAWTQPKGTQQVINSMTGYYSSHYFDGDSKTKKSDANFRKSEISKLVEYGYSDDTTLGFNGRMENLDFNKKDLNTNIFDFRQCGGINTTPGKHVTMNIVEGDLFFRHKLYDQDSFVFSVQPLVKTPCLIRYEDGNYSVAGKTTDFELRFLGGYAFKWEPSADWGERKRPFSGQYHFADLEVAYRKRSSLFSDQIKIDGTLGFRPSDDWLLLGQFFTTIGINKEPVRGLIANSQVYFEEDSFNSSKIQFSVIKQISKESSIQAAVFQEIYGRNSGEGTGLIFSIWKNF